MICFLIDDCMLTDSHMISLKIYFGRYPQFVLRRTTKLESIDDKRVKKATARCLM